MNTGTDTESQSEAESPPTHPPNTTPWQASYGVVFREYF